MANQVVDAQSSAGFEYEILGSDQEPASPWINPEKLKLRHRIGRGTFGDVWLASHRQSTEDSDDYHEVAVKMFPHMKEEHMNNLLAKLDDLFLKCQGLEGVCSLLGFSIISGKISVVMKFYEGSIGDKIAKLRGGKLSVPDVLRYGVELAKGILELHSNRILVLNLKPTNVLLSENDKAILGDFGVPYLLLGSGCSNSDMFHRLGSPNYMAPEQWQPEVRGPISFETDSWGFGCTIVEMLTGCQPWHGSSVDEIHDLVVRKHEKPQIPFGLPSAVENVLLGCFEYDLRNRPFISDILNVFESSQNSFSSDGEFATLRSGIIVSAPRTSLGYTEWLILKDRLQVGDAVRSRKPINSCRVESMNIPEGSVVGLERDTDREHFVLVRVHGIHSPVRVHVSTLERVTLGLAAGDWLRLKEEERKKHSPIGVLHSIQRDGKVAVGFIGMETLWEGSSSEFEMAESYCPGQFVRLRPNVLSPRFDWPRKRGGAWSTGKIQWVLPNGCLVVKFPGMLTFKDENSEYLCDPAEAELVSFEMCPGMVKKYQHLEDFHWAVRPVLVALGLFTAMKMGLFVGGRMGRRFNAKKGRHGDDKETESQRNVATKTADSPGWRPKVVKLF